MALLALAVVSISARPPLRWAATPALFFGISAAAWLVPSLRLSAAVLVLLVLRGRWWERLLRLVVGAACWALWPPFSRELPLLEALVGSSQTGGGAALDPSAVEARLETLFAPSQVAGILARYDTPDALLLGQVTGIALLVLAVLGLLAPARPAAPDNLSSRLVLGAAALPLLGFVAVVGVSSFTIGGNLSEPPEPQAVRYVALILPCLTVVTGLALGRIAAVRHGPIVAVVLLGVVAFPGLRARLATVQSLDQASTVLSARAPQSCYAADLLQRGPLVPLAREHLGRAPISALLAPGGGPWDDEDRVAAWQSLALLFPDAQNTGPFPGGLVQALRDRSDAERRTLQEQPQVIGAAAWCRFRHTPPSDSIDPWLRAHPEIVDDPILARLAGVAAGLQDSLSASAFKPLAIAQDVGVEPTSDLIEGHLFGLAAGLVRADRREPIPTPPDLPATHAVAWREGCRFAALQDLTWDPCGGI